MNDRVKKVLLILTLSFSMMISSAHSAFAFGKGTSGPDVYAVQGMLKSLGFYKAANITGYFGNLTDSVVRQYQYSYGLPVTGDVDFKTLQSILVAYASLEFSKISPSTNPRPTPAPPPPPSVTPKPAPTPTPAPVPSPKPTQGPPTTPSGVTADESHMVDLVNHARASAGLSAVQLDSSLARVARTKSVDMVNNHYFDHQSPTYGSPFDMMTNFGITYRTAGENIACNQNVDAAEQAFMNSAGHRANILNQNFTRIGVGIATGGPCGQMYTQEFIGK